MIPEMFFALCCTLCLLLEKADSARLSNVLLSAISVNTDDDSVTFRIRTSSGAMSRILIKGSETIAELHLKAIQTIGIGDVAESVNHTFSFHGMTYNSLDLQSNTTRISDTSLSHGDIIEILSGAERTIKSSSEGGGNRPRRAPPAVSAVKKNTFSMTDLAKRKESLMKIKRQKANISHIVRLSPETSRILKRVSDKKGVALLLGKHIKSTPKSPVSKQASIRSTSDEGGDKDYFDIVSACELFVHSGNSDECNIDSYPSKIADCNELVDRIKKLAKTLHLDVVGCCISLPSVKIGDPSPPRGSKPKQPVTPVSTWTSMHIHSSLQLFERLQPEGEGSESVRNSSDFVILSVKEEIKSNEKDKGKFISGGGKLGTGKGKKSKKEKEKIQQQKLSASLGISIEAYQLTDQASVLHSKGILPTIPLESSRTANAQEGKSGRKGATSSSQRQGAKQEPDRGGILDVVHLTSPVLIKTDETQEVSSILLSVPLAVTALSTSSATALQERSAATLKVKRPLRRLSVEERHLPAFEHVYPSTSEISGDPPTAEVAKQYLIRVLKKVDPKKVNSHNSMCTLLPETAQRLRDAHLLLYLNTIITGSVFDQLCEGLLMRNTEDDTDSESVFLPVDVAISLDMIKDTLQYAGGDDDDE